MAGDGSDAESPVAPERDFAVARVETDRRTRETRSSRSESSAIPTQATFDILFPATPFSTNGRSAGAVSFSLQHLNHAPGLEHGREKRVAHLSCAVSPPSAPPNRASADGLSGLSVPRPRPSSLVARAIANRSWTLGLRASRRPHPQPPCLRWC